MKLYWYWTFSDIYPSEMYVIFLDFTLKEEQPTAAAAAKPLKIGKIKKSTEWVKQWDIDIMCEGFYIINYSFYKNGYLYYGFVWPYPLKKNVSDTYTMCHTTNICIN